MNEENGNGNKAFFSKLTSHYDALAMVQDTSKAFVIIGCLTALASLFTSLYGLVDAGIYLSGAFFVRRYQSRAAAWCLLTYATVVASLMLTQLLGLKLGVNSGASSIFFVLIGLWAGARAVEATTKLKGSLSATAGHCGAVD